VIIASVVYVALMGYFLDTASDSLMADQIDEVQMMQEMPADLDLDTMLKPKTGAAAKVGKPSKGAKVGKPSKGKKTKKGGPFGEFISGCVMICFAIPMVWMNERKQVKID